MNMFKKVKAKTSKEYFASVTPERKKDMLFLDSFIRKTVPKLKPNFLYNMPGYGLFKHRNYKHEIIEWPVVALAAQKNYISLYVCAVDGKKYLAEQYAKQLGKVSVGKSCIRFKKVEDIQLPVLRKLLTEAAKHPGLPG